MCAASAVFASGDSLSTDVSCRTPAGYVRVASNGQCRRNEKVFTTFGDLDSRLKTLETAATGKDEQIASLVAAVETLQRAVTDLQARAGKIPAGSQIAHGFVFYPGVSLASAELRYRDVSGFDLTGADFSFADFQGGNLSGANLYTANFWTANLTGANLFDANLANALLADANLSGADLSRASVAGAELASINLTGANLDGTDFTGAHLCYVLSGGVTGTPTSLPGGWQLLSGYLVGATANLTGANLSGMNLMTADLELTTLTGADLSGSNLTGLNLTGTNLSGANLSGSNLTGVNLRYANLSGANLSGVVSGGITGTPDALPAGWAIQSGVLVHS